MNSFKRGLLLIVSVCMLFTQSMWVTAAPMKMSMSEFTQTQTSTMDCHQTVEKEAKHHDCCQQGNEHQCNNECGQCFMTSISANLIFNTQILADTATQPAQHSNLNFFYQYRPDDGLRPPIA